MQKYRSKIIQGMAIAFGVFVVLLVLADVRELADTLRTFSVWLFLPIVLLKLVNWMFRYLEWHVLLGVVGVKVLYKGESAPASAPDKPATLSLRDSIAIYLSGFPMAISPGKAGEVLKSAIVKAHTDVPIARTAPVVMTERIVDGLAVLIIIGVAALLGGESVIKDVEGVEASTIQALVLATLVGMMAGIGVIQIKPLSLWGLNLISKIPLLRRLYPWLSAFYESTYELLKLKRLVPTTGFGLVAYGTDCIALCLMLRGFDVSITGEIVAQASFILGFAVIVAALSAMPGGAGARELSVSVLIVGIIGTSDSVANTITLLNSFFQVGLGVLVGTAVALIFRRVIFPERLDAILEAENTTAKTPPLDSAVAQK